MPSSARTRWLCRLAAAVALTSLAVASAAPLPARAQRSRATVNLTIWSWVPKLDTAVAVFNSTHPGIHVTWNLVPALGFYPKLATALKGHNAPDLAQVEFQALPTFESTGSLVDLSKYGAAAYQSKFVPWTWSQVSLGKAIYAIPQDTGPMAMYYRQDVFSKYHIAVPKTWAEYAAAAAKLHKANPQYYIADFSPSDPGNFAGLVWQAGGRWFRINQQAQAWKVGINDPASKQVAQFWQGLLSKKLVRTDPGFTNGWYHDLQSGGACTWISAVWGANTIMTNAPNTQGKWRVAPMPQWKAGQHVVGNWGGSTTVVTADSKYPKEAALFAEFLNSNLKSVDKMVTGAQIYPAATAGQDLRSVNAPMPFYGNQDINRIFQSESRYVDTSFQWGPTMVQVYSDWTDAVDNAVAGKTTLPAALDQVQRSTIAGMKKQGFSVQQ